MENNDIEMVAVFEEMMKVRKGENNRRGTKPSLMPEFLIRLRFHMFTEQQKKQMADAAAAGYTASPGQSLSNTVYPSTNQFSTLKRTNVSELRLEMPAKGYYLLLRILEEGCMITGWHTLAEDDSGIVFVFSLYNYPPKELFKVGDVLILKEPYFKIAGDGSQTVRCDCPTDIIALRRSHPMFHLVSDVEWQNVLCETAEDPLLSLPLPVLPEEWKERGNALYKRGELVWAQDAYLLGLNLCDQTDVNWKLLYLNLAAVYLELGYFEKSAYSSNLILQKFPREMKALLRAGKANYNLRKFDDALIFFEKFRLIYPADPEGQKELERVRLRIKEQKSGSVPIKKLRARSKADPLKKFDCADYVGPVKIVPVPGKGRGVVLTEDVAKGTLLIVSKAFAAYLGPCNYLGLRLNSNNTVDSSDCVEMVKEAVQAVTKNPNTFGPLIYDLSAGNEPRKNVKLFCDPMTKQEPICDVELIKTICTCNSFGLKEDHSIYGEAFGGTGCGLFIFPSYINHSCAPNCNYNVYNDVMLIYAEKSLKAGEEICISYIPLTKTLEERKKLIANRGFICKCERCQLQM